MAAVVTTQLSAVADMNREFATMIVYRLPWNGFPWASVPLADDAGRAQLLPNSPILCRGWEHWALRRR